MVTSITAVEYQQALIDAEVSSYRQATFADNTKKTYLSQLRVYVRFCLYFGYKIVPCNTKTLVRYIIFLARNHVPSSVKQYLNVIRLIHLENGYENPLKENYVLNSVTKGIARVKGVPPKRKLPITPELLIAFYHLLDMSVVENLVFYCACVVAFFSFFRKSTLLSKDLESHDPASNLCRKDVKFLADGALLSVRHTKTIQFHERVLQVPLTKSDTILCPRRFLQLMFHMCPNVPEEAPLFSFHQKGILKCLSHSNFVSKLKDLVAMVGLNAADFSGHSFRRAGATYAWQNGMSVQLIMAQGDWKSDSWMRYVNISMQDRVLAANKLADSIKKLVRSH